MICSKFLFIFLVSLSIFLVVYASTLKKEEIIGGDPASKGDFKYQAAILGKYNATASIYLLCSAVIITDFLLMAAARCFIYRLNELKKYTFFGAIGTDILPNSIDVEEIEAIYTYFFNNIGTNKDLAIAKLKYSLNLQNHRNLAALGIPDKRENFAGQTGIVSGFGVNRIHYLNPRDKRERIRLTSRNAPELKQANVLIVSDGHFSQNRSNRFLIVCGKSVGVFTEICGKILGSQAHEHRGVCVCDMGAPLVIGTKVVGILSRRNPHCDDTIDGSLYTKVANFKDFIDALKEGRVLHGVKAYPNPVYI